MARRFNEGLAGCGIRIKIEAGCGIMKMFETGCGIKLQPRVGMSSILKVGYSHMRDCE